MAHVSYSSYQEDDDNYSSDDSFEWTGDSNRRTKRKTKTKAKTTKTTTGARGAIKKAKKPGRKPLESEAVLPSDPKLKRKAQNRAAQRAFRERKEQFVNELQEQMRQLKAEKEKRERELAAENERLKQENERLKEENSLLKDGYEFPQHEETEKCEPMPMVSPPISDDQITFSSSDMDSPLMNSPPMEESTSCCGCDGNSGSSNCGELSDYQGSTSDSAKSAPEAIFSNAMPEFTFSSDQTSSDLLNCKDVMFGNDYHIPSNEPDLMIQTEPLAPLFGTDMGLFGDVNPVSYNIEELDPLFSEQMQSLMDQDSFFKCAPDSEKPCKKRVISVLQRSRGANRSVYQVNQDVKRCCPEIDLDGLCDDLKKKLSCSTHILTEDEVDLYIECIQRKS